MKFNVIICEDVKNAINRISSVVFEYFAESEIEIDCYQLQSDFEKAITFAKSTDGTRNVYLLDTDLKDRINGLTLAQKIREYDYLGYIVFITSHTEFGVKALSYKLTQGAYVLHVIDILKMVELKIHFRMLAQ